MTDEEMLSWLYADIDDLIDMEYPTERKEDEGMKICELKIKDMASVNSITQALLLNGYEVQSAVMWKEFPQIGIDCFMIAIFDHQTEKGGVQE